MKNVQRERQCTRYSSTDTNQGVPGALGQQNLAPMYVCMARATDKKNSHHTEDTRPPKPRKKSDPRLARRTRKNMRWWPSSPDLAKSSGLGPAHFRPQGSRCALGVWKHLTRFRVVCSSGEEKENEGRGSSVTDWFEITTTRGGDKNTLYVHTCIIFPEDPTQKEHA